MTTSKLSPKAWMVSLLSFWCFQKPTLNNDAMCMFVVCDFGINRAKVIEFKVTFISKN